MLVVSRPGLVLLLAVSGCALVADPGALAADSPKLGWADAAELSFVSTAGNSESSTFGLRNTLTRTWTAARFECKLAGLRAESTTKTTVVDAANPPALLVLEDTRVTAESYLLTARYDRDVSKRLFWYAGAGWDRNEFAGIENRYSAVGGVGQRWWDREDLLFRTDYGVTVTRQDNVVAIPGQEETFAGLRVSWAYRNRFGANTTYTNDLILDQNLDDTSDWRADMLQGIAVAMSERLALKVGLRWLYDHEPSFQLLTASVDSAGNPVVPPVTQLAQLDELDSIFTVSLVVNF